MKVECVYAVVVCNVDCHQIRYVTLDSTLAVQLWYSVVRELLAEAVEIYASRLGNVDEEEYWDSIIKSLMSLTVADAYNECCTVGWDEPKIERYTLYESVMQ